MSCGSHLVKRYSYICSIYCFSSDNDDHTCKRIHVEDNTVTIEESQSQTTEQIIPVNNRVSLITSVGY